MQPICQNLPCHGLGSFWQYTLSTLLSLFSQCWKAVFGQYRTKSYVQWNEGEIFHTDLKHNAFYYLNQEKACLVFSTQTCERPGLQIASR